MSNDDQLLAACAKALTDTYYGEVGQADEFTETVTKMAAAVLSLARPIIRAEALEEAAKVCESGGAQLLTGTTHIVERGFREHFAGMIRALANSALAQKETK